MQNATAEIIQDIVAPAVMIPASAMLLLSSTARMNVVLARIRTFHAEMLDIWCQDPAEGTKQGAVRETRLSGLDHQVDRLLRRARLLRITMLILFAAIGCNLLSVLGLAARYIVDLPSVVQGLSVYVFIAGVLLTLAAMITSVLEVGRILETLLYEHGRVGRLLKSDPAGYQPSNAASPAERVGL
ncbi:MAG: DUF2721 domain-containing protein [Planctomycetota bacterium]